MKSISEIFESLFDDIGDNNLVAAAFDTIYNSKVSSKECKQIFVGTIEGCKGSKQIKSIPEMRTGIYAMFTKDRSNFEGLIIMNMKENECMSWYDFQNPADIAYGTVNDVTYEATRSRPKDALKVINNIPHTLIYKITEDTWNIFTKYFNEYN